MKDLEGGLGAEKKCVTGIFFGLLRIFWGINVKKSPHPLVRGSSITGTSRIDLKKLKFIVYNLQKLTTQQIVEDQLG